MTCSLIEVDIAVKCVVVGIHVHVLLGPVVCCSWYTCTCVIGASCFLVEI